ncbi:MAG TPA: hypothetical protein VM370_02590 [Candidatus Thermoplasmatota archaeon]|nr:hypothetical protein [Candidatus Thermoplasmatota archaeon]
MGDRRYDAAYDQLLGADDVPARIRAMSDTEVIHALAAASRKMNAYLANVLAVEVLHRHRRQRALLAGATWGLGLAIVLRTLLLLYESAHPGALGGWLLGLAFLSLVPASIVAFVAYWIVRRRGTP